jgi:hypothetical protein
MARRDKHPMISMGCLISDEMDEFISAISSRKTAWMAVFRGTQD